MIWHLPQSFMRRTSSSPTAFNPQPPQTAKGRLLFGRTSPPLKNFFVFSRLLLSASRSSVAFTPSSAPISSLMKVLKERLVSARSPSLCITPLRYNRFGLIPASSVALEWSSSQTALAASYPMGKSHRKRDTGGTSVLPDVPTDGFCLGPCSNSFPPDPV